MNNNSTRYSDIQDAVIPQDARALLVWRNDDGSNGSKLVCHGASVLNIERDLRSHMNDYPYPDDWLIQLRDYIDQRLAARREARTAGGFSVPTQGGARLAMCGGVAE